MRRSKAGGTSADFGALSLAWRGAARRSVTILAASKAPDNAALTGHGIRCVSKQIPVSTSEPMKSRLLTGVTGATGLAPGSRFRRQNPRPIPGTGSLQM